MLPQFANSLAPAPNKVALLWKPQNRDALLSPPSPTVPAVGEQTSPRPFGKKRRKCARIVSSDEEDGESAEVNGLFKCGKLSYSFGINKHLLS